MAEGITGVRRPRPRRHWRLIGVLVLIALAVLDLVAHRFLAAPTPILLFIAFTVNAFTPPTRIDEAGIHRAHLRRGKRLVGWDEVESIQTPKSWESGLTLQLVNGRSLALTDIPITQADAVAALGHKEVRPQPRAARPTSAPRPPSPDQIERDLDRRAADLASHRAQLAAEWAKIERGRPR